MASLRSTLGAWLAVFFLSLHSVAAQTAPANPELAAPAAKIVGVRLIEPFVMKNGDTYSGFSVDLWRAIERELNWSSTFVPHENVRALIEAVQDRKVDLGIAAISITASREEVIDFSQPMFDSGLQIMVRQEATGGSPIQNMWAFLTSDGFRELLIVLAVLIFVPLPIIWLVERPRGSQMIEANTRLGAFFKSIWWTATTLIGQGTDTPMSVGGKLVAIVWMFVGLVFVSYFTGNVTAALTVQRLESGISGPGDLYGRQVVTVKGTTAAAYLAQLGIPAKEAGDIAAAFAAIEDKSAEAMVYDAPVLLYYAATRGQGRVMMAGPVFKPEAYGIAFPLGSGLREDVNRALLRVRESGRYQEIYDRWFRRIGATG